MEQNEHLSYQLGLDGFIWFMGVVEDMSSDPLKIGRAKVRIIGWHTPDHDELPTAALPWAYPLAPVTHAGTLPSYKTGDWVVGFFLDGKLGQQPMLCWVLPAIPQRNLLGGLVKTAVKTALKSHTGM